MVEVLGQIEMASTMLLLQAAEQTEISCKSGQKLLKRHKLKLTRELGSDDPARWIEFGGIMTTRSIAQPPLIKHICFTDEWTFYSNSKMNKVVVIGEISILSLLK